MCRITNISSMIARRMYATQEKNLNLAMQRLSSGLRINRAADDPAGLIASETLRREQVSLKAAISNAQRASNVVATAEGALNEISGLLVELNGLITSSANESALGESEIEANQLQIDSIIEAITRISNTTAFAEKNLLNGSLDFQLSGVPASAISDVQIHSARFAEGDTRNVLVEVRQSALFGQLKYTGSQVGALTLQVAGQNGGQTLTFASGISISAIAASINQSRDYLGMSATLSGNAAIYFSSTDVGEDSFVRVKAIEGTFNLTGGQDGLSKGRDAEVLVNGAAAAVHGNMATVSSEAFSAQMVLDKAFLQSLSTKSFDIVGGGATFCISPNIQDGQVAIEVTSDVSAITFAAGSGQLELNAFLPLIADKLLSMLRNLVAANRLTAEKCIRGITANVDHCRSMVFRSAALTTVLLPIVGYHKATKIAAYMRDNKTDIFIAAEAIANITPAQLEKLITPDAVNALGFAENRQEEKS